MSGKDDPPRPQLKLLPPLKAEEVKPARSYQGRRFKRPRSWLNIAFLLTVGMLAIVLIFFGLVVKRIIMAL